MNIKSITWPIFYLGTDIETYSDMNVLYVIHSGAESILDNKNLAGGTLGARRLRIKNEKLYNFKKTLFMLSELIDFTRSKKISDRKFIDSSGKLFTYNKTKVRPLIWRRIKNIEYYGTYVLLIVHGLLTKFELPHNYWVNFRDLDEVYLGLLEIDDYHIIYDIDIVKHKDTWRKV